MAVRPGILHLLAVALLVFSISNLATAEEVDEDSLVMRVMHMGTSTETGADDDDPDCASYAPLIQNAIDCSLGDEDKCDRRRRRYLKDGNNKDKTKNSNNGNAKSCDVFCAQFKNLSKGPQYCFTHSKGKCGTEEARRLEVTRSSGHDDATYAACVNKEFVMLQAIMNAARKHLPLECMDFYSGPWKSECLSSNEQDE